jgi:hypothetical protein
LRNLEHQHAVALVRWWAYFSNTHKIDRRLLWAVPNGGLRNIRVAMKLKAEGVIPGVPDYMLAIPSPTHHGLFIELKAPKGRLSTEQDQMLVLLGSRGYKCVVAYGWEHATQAISEYLDLKAN